MQSHTHTEAQKTETCDHTEIHNPEEKTGTSTTISSHLVRYGSKFQFSRNMRADAPWGYASWKDGRLEEWKRIQHHMLC